MRAQWDVLRPVTPLPPSDPALRRMSAGVDFEADVFRRLAGLHPDAVVVDRGGPDDRDARERHTVRAMESGAPVILGGRLPVDLAARRVGEPDVLLAAPGGGYHPVDVKHHRTLAADRGVPVLVSDLADPGHDAAVPPVDDLWAVKRKDDLFQLAHYRRLLEACGHAAPDAVGAIIGSELAVTWYDLDQPMWTTPSRTEGTKRRSTLDVYDFEFAFRLDTIAVARRHAQDPTVDLLVVPVRTGQCATCPWWGHCEGLLEAAGDVSLLPHCGWTAWSAHRERGVRTLSDLAALDQRTAELADRGVDLPHLFGRLAEAAGAAPIGEVIGRVRRRQVAELAAAGVATAADARSLDRRVAAYAGTRLGSLASSIDLARARLAGPPVFRARGLDRIDVPRGDVEVDLDLENADDGGVYLWGALVTDRSATGLTEPGYRSFVTWDADLAAGEVHVVEQLCTWLAGLLDRATRAGRTVTVYCYNERAEADALLRLARAPGVDPGRADFVERLVTSPAWVDLLAVCRAGLVTGRSMGLKHLAPLAGFSWEDPDPGGEQSMTWYHHATTEPDPDVRAAYRRRILTYNRNDVEATLALRDWLEREGPALPSISSLDPLRPG